MRERRVVWYREGAVVEEVVVVVERIMEERRGWRARRRLAGRIVVMCMKD